MFRMSCKHDWKPVAFDNVTPLEGRVVHVCEKCDSFSYRAVRFIGYRLESLEDKFENDATSTGDT